MRLQFRQLLSSLLFSSPLHRLHDSISTPLVLCFLQFLLHRGARRLTPTVLPLSRASYVCLMPHRLHTATHAAATCISCMACIRSMHCICIGVLEPQRALADLVAVRAALWVPADRQPISCAFYSAITDGHRYTTNISALQVSSFLTEIQPQTNIHFDP